MKVYIVTYATFNDIMNNSGPTIAGVFDTLKKARACTPEVIGEIFYDCYNIMEYKMNEVDTTGDFFAKVIK